MLFTKDNKDFGAVWYVCRQSLWWWCFKRHNAWKETVMLLIKLSSIRVLKPKILYEQQKQIFGKKMYLRALRHGTSNKKTYSFRIVTVSMYRASNILATSFATFYQLCNLYTNKFYLTKKKKKNTAKYPV